MKGIDIEKFATSILAEPAFNLQEERSKIKKEKHDFEHIVFDAKNVDECAQYSMEELFQLLDDVDLHLSGSNIIGMKMRKTILQFDSNNERLKNERIL